MPNQNLVSKQRGYKVLTTEDAKEISLDYLNKVLKLDFQPAFFGLPEVDDRFHIWRVPLLENGSKVGEVVIDAKSGGIDSDKTTNKDIIVSRISEFSKKKTTSRRRRKHVPKISDLTSTVIMGRSQEELLKLPEESVNLVFTSPPYYNAKPEYSEYTNYEEYLEVMRDVIKSCARVLSEGRFFVLNVSPVLLRRASRSESSRRIAVPFDFHRLFMEEGFEFIDDIHWVKPTGAGWSFGRGRRFSADRNPLQYKPVPVTEYLLVYRKKTNKLIDWNIREHQDQEAVKNSKIEDGYEVTNLWNINPSRSKVHPATFPIELADRVIKYYSFENDVVLDPFGGIGTTAKSAVQLKRRFVICELEEKYIDDFRHWIRSNANLAPEQIDYVNCCPPKGINLALDL